MSNPFAIGTNLGGFAAAEGDQLEDQLRARLRAEARARRNQQLGLPVNFFGDPIRERPQLGNIEVDPVTGNLVETNPNIVVSPPVGPPAQPNAPDPRLPSRQPVSRSSGTTSGDFQRRTPGGNAAVAEERQQRQRRQAEAQRNRGNDILEDYFGEGIIPGPPEEAEPASNNNPFRSDAELAIFRIERDLRLLDEREEELSGEQAAEDRTQIEAARLQLESDLRDAYAAERTINQLASAYQQQVFGGINTSLRLGNEAAQRAGQQGLSTAGLSSTQRVLARNTAEQRQILGDLDDSLSAISQKRAELAPILSEFQENQAVRAATREFDAATQAEELDPEARQAELERIENERFNLEIQLEANKRRKFDEDNPPEDPEEPPLNTYGGRLTDAEALRGFELWRGLASQPQDTPEAALNRFTAKLIINISQGSITRDDALRQIRDNFGDVETDSFGNPVPQLDAEGNFIDGSFTAKDNSETRRAANIIDDMLGFADGSGLQTRAPVFDHLFLSTEQLRAIANWRARPLTDEERAEGVAPVPYRDPIETRLGG